jgi:hypothetical protein
MLFNSCFVAKIIQLNAWHSLANESIIFDVLGASGASFAITMLGNISVLQKGERKTAVALPLLAAGSLRQNLERISTCNRDICSILISLFHSLKHFHENKH